MNDRSLSGASQNIPRLIFRPAFELKAGVGPSLFSKIEERDFLTVSYTTITNTILHVQLIRIDTIRNQLQ